MTHTTFEVSRACGHTRLVSSEHAPVSAETPSHRCRRNNSASLDKGCDMTSLNSLRVNGLRSRCNDQSHARCNALTFQDPRRLRDILQAAIGTRADKRLMNLLPRALVHWHRIVDDRIRKSELRLNFP